ncbi:MAM and LDL-receptor class A domain-containing protein 1-like [Tetranychus urticae]|uniref:MAM and LDL-receptor class A domain-containing protein 1-like n=1 Tax=Tetranychus urticae TaxID=32264 RepID=UPI00077BB8B7|nr:MAM and LDL-receptor class A domain-containing protein 1-like [Tetranychus urticae]
MIRLKICFTLTINVIFLLVSIKETECSTDSLKALGCDFINDTCDWESNTLSLGGYSYPLHFDQPDRTFQGQPLQGNYIWSETGGQLKSSLISPGDGQFCISFHYYMFGFDVGTLNLESILTNQNSQKVDLVPIWSRSGSNYDGWSEQSLTIDLNHDYFTILQFTITSSGIFLGPLRVSSGSCTKTIDCSFDDFSSCNWFIESDVNYPNFKWTIKDEKVATASNLTSNKYLVTSNVLVNIPASTRFISENIFSSWSTQCLEFNIFKPDNKRDRVQIFYSFNNSSLVPIWSSSSIESQQNWINVKIQLKPSGQSDDDYKIMIVGDKYSESKDDSSIAIDDLSIDFKSCASEQNCDFSENTCGYIFSKNSFLLGYGRLPDSNIFTNSFSKVFSNANMFLYNIPTSKTSDYVLTSPTLPSSKATCLQFRLFFSQSSHNNAFAQVMINYVSSSGESMSQSVSQFNSDQLEKQSDAWTQYKVTLANEKPFSVSFLFHGSKSFFAIDDIKFENGLCHQDSDIPSTIGTVHLSENFDDEVSHSNWLVNTWKHKHKFDSRFDHPIVDATHKYFGGYIYIDSTHSQQEAIITSKKFNGLGPYCLSLSYWCSIGNNKISIELNNRKLENNETIYVRDCIGNDDNWKNLEKSFLMNGDFQISIEGSSEDSKLALDEVSLRIGSCSLQAKDSIECTFEADVYCPLEVEPSMHQLWKVSSGYDLSVEMDDKTTESKKGSVIALEFPFAPNTRDTSYFFIPLKKHSGLNCLQFSYKVNCDCSLSTWIADRTSDSSKIKPFYSINYNLGLRWYQKRIALMMNSSHKIIFGGSYEPSSHGSIVLDDIFIKAGTCESEFMCDFESECLWNTLPLSTVVYIDQPSMQLTVDSEWTIGMPNASYPNQYPPIDYTLYDDKGSYIHTLNEEGASVLASQPFPIPKGTQYVCLSFAYSLPYNDSYPTSRLEIYLHYLDGSISSVRQLSPTKSTYSYSPWSFAKLSIQIDSKHQDNVLFLYIVANGPGPKSIDDINLNIGHCEEKTFFECGNNEKIAVSSVCDFIIDCKNGKDEVNCGDCTFDGSKCGYSSNDWDITNGYATFVPSPFSNVITPLTSPVISHSSSSCLLSFEYQTEFVDTLTVEILMEHREALKIWFNSNYQNSSVDHWTSSQVSIGRISHSFRISFNSEIVNSKIYPTISIRNVKLLNCGYDKTIKTEKQFICKDGARISLDKKCDGTFDCPKGEDEVSCSYMIYNFEDDSLNNDWLSTSNSISKWEIVTGSGQLETRPSRDHTTGSSYGHFAFLPYITSDSKIETYFFGPLITNTVGCAITFYFNNPNPAFSLRLVIKDSETNEVLETLTEVTGQNDFVKHTVRTDSISMRLPFHLNFIGVQSSPVINEYENDAKYIALDDIIFSDKCYSSLPDASKKAKPSVTCHTDQFTCAEDFSCIDESYVCNGKSECPYGSDEANCGSCDFNSNDFCSWLSTGSNQWVLVKPQEVRHNLYPSTDGSGDTSGQYLAVTNKNSDGNAILKSPVLFSTRDECILNFRYFLPYHGPHLMIKLVKNSLEKTLDTLSPRGDDFRWRSGSVSLGGLGNGYQLLFIAYQLPENAPTFYPVGLDSFKMTNCYGDEKENVDFDFSCDFQETLCSWYIPDLISSTNSVWKITNTPSDVGVWHQLPEEDDFYIHVLSDTNSKETNQAVLTSLWHSPVDSSCLKITYRMFCRFGCSLSLDMQEKSLYSTQIMNKVDSQSNGWIEQFVNIKSGNEFRLKFNASANTRITQIDDTDSEDFIIALKSIKFDEGKECPVNGVCDFELDNCIWSLDGLERIEAAAINIMSDHSLGVASGHILSLDKSQSAMRALISNDLYWTDKCLTFWTTPLAGKKDVISIIYNSATLSKEYQITSDEVEMNSNSAWIYRRVNVQLEHSNLVNSGNLTIEFNIESDKDHFAIDDVSLHEKPCESPGSCSFEEDTCGWHNTGTVSWLRNSGSTPSPYSGPDKDSSGQFGWYLFVDERELKYNNSAQLESESLSISPEICIVFDYYLYSKVSNQSNIGAIIVFIKESGTLNRKIVDTIAPPSSSRWMKHSLSLTNLPLEYRIIFSAVGGTSESGDIAIDNIELLPGNCSDISSKTNPQKLFACNFDDGTLCGSRISNMQISNGLSAKSKKAPEIDHMNGTQKGNYLLSKESQSFISKDINFINNSNVCFKFYYFIDSTTLSSQSK